RRRSLSRRRPRHGTAVRGRRVRRSGAPGAWPDHPSLRAGLGRPVTECPVARSARARPDAPALIWRGRTSSYRDLDALIRRWHGAIAARGPARIAVRGENQPKMVALIHAAARAGVPLALL